jgi:tetratricopeptide (TPR) repeat protein
LGCPDENTIAAFVEGRLGPEAIAEIERHAATCVDCTDLLSAALGAGGARSRAAGETALGASVAVRPRGAPPTVNGELAKGAAVGRYTILGLVGRGGMGEVYAAYDPELDRKVAIKLLRASGDGIKGRARLQREAQAIAKLQSPNVVVVYEVGTLGDGVFVAMEFVAGRTLSAWMKAEKRARREVLQVFVAAGRGLEAAHAAGLVHRDFKPDNVMVKDDGQVRVMDFGLAHQTDEVPELGEVPLSASDGVSSGRYLAVKLTQTGALLGTPTYMAPEQFAAQATDARTDQFSFCVALYEALYGERPFAGNTVVELMGNVVSGKVRSAPARSDVPGWLRKVLLRGLAERPDGRYPSMTALLAALEDDPRRRWRRWAIGASTVAVLAGVAFFTHRLGEGQRLVCKGAGARFDGIWETAGTSSARKTAIRRAFLATGQSYADQAFTGAAELLDRYVARWTAMYVDACEATHVRGAQSAEVLDLRMGCLDERLGAVRALVDRFESANAAVVENALAAATALPGLDRCADVPLLKAVIRPPEDAASRARVEALRAEKARMVAMRDAGGCAKAEIMARDLIPRVRREGYPPLLAETLNAAGFLSDVCTDPEVGVARYKEAFVSAQAAHHDEAAAEAAIIIASYEGNRLGKPGEGRAWLTVAEGELKRWPNHPLLDSWFLLAEGMSAYSEGRSDAAIDAFLKATAIKERLLGSDNPETLLASNDVGIALTQAGRGGEAAARLRQVRDTMARVLGAEHAKVAFISSNEGEALNADHRHAEAREAYERALRIWRKNGAAPSFIAYAQTGVGVALLGLDRPAEAIAPLEEALRGRLEGNANHADLGEARFALARALWTRPDAHDRALSLARAARDDAQASSQKTKADEIEAWLARAAGPRAKTTNR